MASLVADTLEQRTESVRHMAGVEVLRMGDPHIVDVLKRATFVCAYILDEAEKEWRRTDVEGALYIVRRDVEPMYRLIVLNQRRPQNLVEDITAAWEISEEERYLFFRVPTDPSAMSIPDDPTQRRVAGLWFSDDRERRSIEEILLNILVVLRRNEAPARSSSSSSTSSLSGVAGRSMSHDSLQEAESASRPPVPQARVGKTRTTVESVFMEAGRNTSLVPPSDMSASAELSAPLIVVDGGIEGQGASTLSPAAAIMSLLGVRRPSGDDTRPMHLVCAPGPEHGGKVAQAAADAPRQRLTTPPKDRAIRNLPHPLGALVQSATRDRRAPADVACPPSEAEPPIIEPTNTLAGPRQGRKKGRRGSRPSGERTKGPGPSDARVVEGLFELRPGGRCLEDIGLLGTAPDASDELSSTSVPPGLTRPDASRQIAAGQQQQQFMEHAANVLMGQSVARDDRQGSRRRRKLSHAQAAALNGAAAATVPTEQLAGQLGQQTLSSVNETWRGSRELRRTTALIVHHPTRRASELPGVGLEFKELDVCLNNPVRSPLTRVVGREVSVDTGRATTGASVLSGRETAPTMENDEAARRPIGPAAGVSPQARAAAPSRNEGFGRYGYERFGQAERLVRRPVPFWPPHRWEDRHSNEGDNEWQGPPCSASLLRNLWHLMWTDSRDRPEYRHCPERLGERVPSRKAADDWLPRSFLSEGPRTEPAEFDMREPWDYYVPDGRSFSRFSDAPYQQGGNKRYYYGPLPGSWSERGHPPQFGDRHGVWKPEPRVPSGQGQGDHPSRELGIPSDVAPLPSGVNTEDIVAAVQSVVQSPEFVRLVAEKLAAQTVRVSPARDPPAGREGDQ